MIYSNSFFSDYFGGLKPQSISFGCSFGSSCEGEGSGGFIFDQSPIPDSINIATAVPIPTAASEPPGPDDQKNAIAEFCENKNGVRVCHPIQ